MVSSKRFRFVLVSLSVTLLSASVLPIAARASPVNIVMQSRGTMYPYDPVLAALGLNGVPDPRPQPFTLTIGAWLDSDAPGVLSDPHVPLFEQFNTQVDVSFQYGAQHYAYKGAGDVLIEAGSQYYERVSIAVPGSPDTHIVAESVVAANGVADFPVLAPPSVGADGASAGQGASAVYVISGAFDDPRIITMSTQTQDVSLTAISPVPEPGRPEMLAAGLVAFLATRLRRRQRNQALPPAIDQRNSEEVAWPVAAPSPSVYMQSGLIVLSKNRVDQEPRVAADFDWVIEYATSEELTGFRNHPCCA